MLHPSLLIAWPISCKIVNNYSTSRLTSVLKYSNSWEISICLLRVIFLLLLIYWLVTISTCCCCCGSNTLDWRLLMMSSIWIRMTTTNINTPWHKINHSFYRLWLFTRLWRWRKNWATELRYWWFHSNRWFSTWFPYR